MFITHPYRFGTTLGLVNADMILICRSTIPLNAMEAVSVYGNKETVQGLSYLLTRNLLLVSFLSA